LYTCFELDPVYWTEIRDACKGVLTLGGFLKYQEMYTDEEDLQNAWDAAVGHLPFSVEIVLGQLDDDNMRALDDSDNWEDTGHYDEIKKNIFLAHHMVRAHKRFLKENPDEVVLFMRLQRWYRQQAAGGHVPGVMRGGDGFWASESVGGNELE
jgi:hypothetical protein